MSTDKKHQLILFFILFLLVLVLSTLMPGKFLNTGNLQSMASQFPEFGLLALAMMLAMVTGGIDLSVVAIANFSGVIAAYILSQTVGPVLPDSIAVPLAVLSVVIISTLCGLFNGILIANFKVPPLLATLGSSSVFMGASIIITKGGSFSTFPETFLFLGSGSVLGIPMPFVVFSLVALLVSVLLKNTRQGFRMYMVGSNDNVARYTGINNKRVIINTYILVALLAGLAGLIIASRVNSMRPGFGEVYLLPAILVAVLGGTDPDGGFGNVFGVVLAILILQITQSGLNILSLSPYLTKLLWGLVLLIVLVNNHFLKIITENIQIKKQQSSGSL